MTLDINLMVENEIQSKTGVMMVSRDVSVKMQ